MKEKKFDLQNRLIDFAVRIIKLAQEIVSGKIDTSPYRLGQVSPCSYCKYKPVCRFDWQINDYNFLKPMSKFRVIEMAEEVDG